MAVGTVTFIIAIVSFFTTIVVTCKSRPVRKGRFDKV